ncbi:hypothetical protein DY000_02037959 [Brassica cretica]|uniref:CBS domain-containing protein n=1 Tax=Brassica cretica TaxID=69181 RepID=A0ABQ7BJR4_BRACR|nr:hypothetical protein DY000_02037959 [Brassica cretica]
MQQRQPVAMAEQLLVSMFGIDFHPLKNLVAAGRLIDGRLHLKRCEFMTMVVTDAEGPLLGEITRGTLLQKLQVLNQEEDQ